MMNKELFILTIASLIFYSAQAMDKPLTSESMAKLCRCSRSALWFHHFDDDKRLSSQENDELCDVLKKEGLAPF